MTLYYDTFPTALGPFSVAVDAQGRVAGTAFGGRTALANRVGSTSLDRSPSLCRAAREQIQDFLAGRRDRFELPLAAQGTPFQQRVWQALREIPFGVTTSYGALARTVGRAGAARAVGRANATNPICLIVPCHRVIGANGSLTGFAFGERLKRQLLALEQAMATRSRAA
jgi:methylated-DNA-[protein]-cysteine S-methyltransferase